MVRRHVRFFTRRSVECELRQAGFKVVRTHVTGRPLDVLTRDGGKVRRVGGLLDRVAVAIQPSPFAYQFLDHCETGPTPTLIYESLIAS